MARIKGSAVVLRPPRHRGPALTVSSHSALADRGRRAWRARRPPVGQRHLVVGVAAAAATAQPAASVTQPRALLLRPGRSDPGGLADEAEGDREGPGEECTPTQSINYTYKMKIGCRQQKQDINCNKNNTESTFVDDTMK